MTEDDLTSQRAEGPTPHGGAYAIAYFRDDAGNAVPRERATSMEIVEFSPEGEAIFRTYGRFGE